jgi:hypothetical protein
MTRSELRAILTDLLIKNVITVEAMALILQQYDEGTLTDLPVSATKQDDNDGWLLALALLALLLNGADITAMSQAERTRARDLLRRQYQTKTRRLAAGVAAGSIRDWQTGMKESIELYARQMAIAGAGGLPSTATRQATDGRLSSQWSFLTRFAVTLLAGRFAGQMMSEAAIAARSNLYGGTGWGSYYLGQGDRPNRGYVDQWITQDDGRVCDRCAPRHRRYFLPNGGPMPGWDCRGDCRCERVRIYNPQIYAQLGGR